MSLPANIEKDTVMTIDINEIKRFAHEYDNDASCIYCGFDGAEYHHWRYNTYEGLAMKIPAPLCITPNEKETIMNSTYITDMRRLFASHLTKRTPSCS